MIWTRFSKKDLKRIRRFFASLHGSVLDIGCGNLRDRVEFTPGDEYIGADITKSKYTTVLADIHNLPFKDESFDAIICNAVLEHIEQPEIGLCELNRVLKQNGTIWVSVPFLQHIHAYYDFRRYTGQGLKYEVEKAGFCVDRLHGSYGIADTIESLLFGALVWKVNDALMASYGLQEYFERKQKTKGLTWEVIKGLMKREGVLGILYIFLIVMFFVLFKILGILFNSQQKKDIHHASSFDIIAHKE